MYRTRSTLEFQRWLLGLKDKRAATRIVARIHRAEDGNLGDVKSVGGDVREMRIPYGPGYRVYFLIDGAELIILLCGGDKSSQHRDIERAKRMALQWRS